MSPFSYTVRGLCYILVAVATAVSGGPFTREHAPVLIIAGVVAAANTIISYQDKSSTDRANDHMRKQAQKITPERKLPPQ